MAVDRIRRVARKPPRYVLGRVVAEARRTGRRRSLAAAAAGRGRLRRDRIVPGGIDRALAVSANQVATMGAWGEATAAAQAEPALLPSLRTRRDRALARELELFGDGRVTTGVPPRWNTDVRSGHGWPQAWYRGIDYRNIGRDSDVKVAWEMSRLRHCVALAQAVAVLEDDEALRAIERDLEDWHVQNPFGFSVNWASAMEVGLRAVNMICIDGILLTARGGYSTRPLVAGSLYQHGWFLSRNLEISDVNGNHFLADAVGLVWLGRFFAGVGEADRWRDRGIAMVLEAADEQVLDDGLDHEGSLPYHFLVLELFLLARVAAGDALKAIDPALRRMLDAASLVVDAEGRVPNMGDDDGGRGAALSDAPSRDGRRVLALGAAVVRHERAAAIAAGLAAEDVLWLLGPPALDQLRDLANAPAQATPERLLPHGGIAVLGDGRDHVVMSVGPVGFRGRGGHGHLDAMSFEATLAGRIVVRDSGTGSYTGDPELREELRDVHAHSAVVLDGLPYARLGGAAQLWSVEGDSPPTVTAVQTEADRHLVRAVQTLPAEDGAATFERELVWSRGRLTCRDEVRAPAGARVEHRLQVPADVRLDGNRAVGSAATYAVAAPREARLRMEECRWSDRYASVEPGRRIVVEYAAAETASEVVWEIAAA